MFQTALWEYCSPATSPPLSWHTTHSSAHTPSGPCAKSHLRYIYITQSLHTNTYLMFLCFCFNGFSLFEVLMFQCFILDLTLKLQSISFASLSPSMSEDLELQLMNQIFRGIYVAVDIYCSSQSQISLCLGIYDLNKYFHQIYALSKYTHLLSWPLESAFAWQEVSAQDCPRS